MRYPHTHDDEPGLHADIERWAQRLRRGRRPTIASAGPHQVIVPITKGQLDLGPWQQIFYYEFDGRRPKRLVMKALGVTHSNRSASMGSSRDARSAG